MPYAILLNELKPLDFQKTARILARARGIIYADATRSLRNCSGILALGLTSEEARLICEELNREGVGVFFMDQSEMYYPEPVVRISNAACLKECFNVQDMYGGVHPLYWPSIILLSLGLIAEEGIILDVFSREPQKKHYRIVHDKFNYDYLGERLTPRALENFRLLVSDLAQLAAQAYGNRGINAFLQDEEPQKMKYNDLDHFDKENLWLLQLIHLESSAPEGEDYRE